MLSFAAEKGSTGQIIAVSKIQVVLLSHASCHSSLPRWYFVNNTKPSLKQCKSGCVLYPFIFFLYLKSKAPRCIFFSKRG